MNTYKIYDSADYITPTKESPIFRLENNYIGEIQTYTYKDFLITKGNRISTGSVFEIKFARAVSALHDLLKEEEFKELLKEYPKSKFEILMCDGSFNKFDEVKKTPVYTISASKALKLLF